jgi:CDP-glucose 4,6-dehydratase
MNIDPAFWNKKKIFLTGHTGFKGTWLSLWLQSMGCEVTGYALPPETNPNLFEMANVADGMNSVTGNVQDFEHLQSAITAAQPDIVLHLAAQALVRYSYDHPVETYATNVMGTVNLLEACRTVPSIRSIVIVTSDKCYENREWERGYVETDAMGGHDPYSSSKGCSELVASAYRNSFFSGDDSNCAVASGRAGNVIGGGDWALDRIVPDTLMAFMRGEAASIRNPNAVRPWQHVLEPLHGYLLLTERLYKEGRTFADGWNFGPADESSVPVGTMVQKMEEIWGGDVRAEINVDPNAVHEATLLRLDCAKAAERLNWHPKLTLDPTLEWTVEWYRALHQGADMRAFTIDQIKQYENL